MPITETTGLLSLNELIPGHVVNTEFYKAQTCFHLEADKSSSLLGIPFGRGVTLSDQNPTEEAYDRLIVRLPEVADTKVIGVAMFTQSIVGLLGTDPDDYDAPRGYKPDRELAVVYKGLVGVEVTTAVSPSDPVYLVTTAGADHGKFKATDTGAIAVPNATWRGYGSAGDVVALSLDLTV